jgi:hypothetical protein
MQQVESAVMVRRDDAARRSGGMTQASPGVRVAGARDDAARRAGVGLMLRITPA